MAEARSLPPPFKGQNDQFPVVQVQNPYCERKRNFHNRGGISTLRDGNEVFARVTDDDYMNALHLAAYGSSKLFVVGTTNDGSDLGWYDVSNGTPSLVHSTPIGGDDEIISLYFNRHLFFFGEVSLGPSLDGPQVYNGSTWGAAGYTWPTAFRPFGGAVHKNRAYFLGRGGADYAFSGIDAISGPTTKVSLEGLLSERADIYILRPIAISQNQAQNVLAALFENGEVLVYGGSYPLASDWGTVSRFQISPIIYHNAFIDAKGDSFILTESEILSLRNLYTGGYEREREEGIGASISNRWKQIVTALIADSGVWRFFIKGTYDKRRDRLVIALPYDVDPDTGAVVYSRHLQLVYDFTLGAWYEYFAANGADEQFGAYSINPAYFQNRVHVLFQRATGSVADGVVCRLDSRVNGGDDPLDGGEPIGKGFLLRSAPFPFPKFGVTQCHGLEAIVRSNMYEQVNLKLISNLGAAETDPQTTEGNGSNISSVLYPVGIEGNLVQYEFSGTSTPEGTLEIHALNPWVSVGEEGSR